MFIRVILTIIILVGIVSKSASAQGSEITNEQLMAQMQSLQKAFSEHLAREQSQQQVQQQQKVYTKAEIKQIKENYKKSCYPLKFDSIQIGADGKVIRVCR